MKVMTTGGLFEGIGVFPLAARNIGILPVWSNDNNHFCCRVLRKNFSHEIIEKSIIDIETIKLARVDIITGGFPCKQTSVSAAIHGKRKGLNGIESGLWYAQINILEAMSPDWCVVENPTGIEEWEDKIQNGLAKIGYTVSRLEYQASDFGLPHKRKRYFYVGNAHGKRLEECREKGSPTINWFKGLAVAGGNWMSTSPGTNRGINGIANRVDRIEALGNAIAYPMALDVMQKIKSVQWV